MKNENEIKEVAILMAAGLGTRMRPITEHVPKPLVKVCGISMIETVIEALLRRGIDEIYVVTGYLQEQFEQLKERYPQIQTIYNKNFNTKNNISSLYAAREVLGKGHCFICESDLFIRESAVLCRELQKSCYFGRMKSGWSEDWVFDVQDERIVRVGKGGEDCFNMTGLSFFQKNDALLLKNYIEEAYDSGKCDDWFWDEVVNAHLKELNLCVEPVEKGAIVEIDTVEELERVEREG